MSASIDVSVAIRASNYDACLPAIEAAADLFRPCGARIEFLVCLPAHSPSFSEPRSMGGAAVRVCPLADGSYRTYFETARDASAGTWLVTLEEPTLRDASLLLAFWHKRHEADVIVASRHSPGSDVEMGYLRRWASRWGNAAIARMLAFPLADMLSGRRMYRTRVIRDVPLEASGRELLLELLVRAYGAGGRLVEVDWHIAERPPLPVSPLALARTVRRMHHERNSGNYPDYDSRAYYSKIWLQRYWQQKRYRIINRLSDRAGACLDVGCGGSRIIKTRPDMVALDLNFHRLRHLQATNMRRVQATAGAIPFAANSFDLVICSQVIEPTLEGTGVSDCVRVLKEGGTLVVGTPDYATFWWPFWEAIYDRVKPHGYVTEHIAHYTYDSLVREVRDAGCEVLEHAYIGGGELIVKAVKKW